MTENPSEFLLSIYIVTLLGIKGLSSWEVKKKKKLIMQLLMKEYSGNELVVLTGEEALLLTLARKESGHKQYEISSIVNGQKLMHAVLKL